jgi:hydrogenase nickel incorporation protein HypA/HybF
MHELSIMESVIGAVELEAIKHGNCSIKKIKLRIGAFTGVVKESLEFCFDALKSNTLAASSELEIETIPLQLKCQTCEKISVPTTEINFLCPYCSQPTAIISGREMQIEYIELE